MSSPLRSLSEELATSRNEATSLATPTVSSGIPAVLASRGEVTTFRLAPLAQRPGRIGRSRLNDRGQRIRSLSEGAKERSD
jgi:hypothetical protein